MDPEGGAFSVVFWGVLGLWVVLFWGGLGVWGLFCVGWPEKMLDGLCDESSVSPTRKTRLVSFTCPVQNAGTLT
jgi:hypothetical protein